MASVATENANPNDREHLKLLTIFYYIFAALDLFGLLVIGTQAVVMGTLFASMDHMPKMKGHETSAPPDIFPFISGILAAYAVIIGIVMVCHLITARSLSTRTNYTFCIVIGAVTCLSFPLGTILGVFTIIILIRPSVKSLFGVTST
ncbi:hypothetical protein GC197_05180 [bacterium]|nr:hypothetical protein [bacterium]